MVVPPCPRGSNQQTFYDYFDLARIAHAREISQLREENKRLKEHIHSFLNRKTGGEHPVTVAGISMGVSHGSDSQSVWSVGPTTSRVADQLLLDELEEIVLHERMPGDVAPTPSTVIVHCFERANSQEDIDLLQSADVPEHPKLLERADLRDTVVSLESAKSLQSGSVWSFNAGDGFMKALARWETICGALMARWYSDIAIMHPSWGVSIYGLARLLSRKEKEFGTQASDRALNNNVAHYQFISCGVLSPGSCVVVIWQCLGMLLCVYDIVMFPIHLIDLYSSEEYFDALNLVVVVFWTIDIAMSLQTGFPTNEGYTELRRLQVFKRYAQTWMPLDVIIVVFDWISVAVNSTRRGTVRGVSRMMRFARMLRIGRLIKLGPSIINFIGQLHSEFILLITKIVSYVLVILTLNHYIACVFYASFDWNGFTWAERHRYLVSLHWAVAHSVLGSMDVAPQSDWERLFSIIMLVLSMVLFSTFLSAITTAVTHLSDLHGYRVKQEGLMRRFFNDNCISRELSRRIWTFMWKHSQLGRRRLRTSDVHSFALLPSHLLAEIKVETFLPILVEHPMFQLCSERSPQAMVKLCLAAIEQIMLRPSEHMLWNMDVEVKAMFFVVDGGLLYKPTWDPACCLQDVTVSKGMWACEAALWCQHARVYGPFVGGPTGADVVQVSAREFQDIMRTSTLSITLFYYAQIFIEKFNEYSHDPDCLDSLFNDPDVIEEVVQATKYRTSGETFEAGWHTGLGEIKSRLLHKLPWQMMSTARKNSARKNSAGKA